MIGDASCGLSGVGDMSSTNPLLGPTANNGGPTPINLPALNTPRLMHCRCVLLGRFGFVTTDQRGISASRFACDISFGRGGTNDTR
jgi:hypothetical protein